MYFFNSAMSSSNSQFIDAPDWAALEELWAKAETEDEDMDRYCRFLDYLAGDASYPEWLPGTPG